MADDPTKLVFTADTTDVEGKVGTLKGVVDDFFRSLGLGAEQTRGLRDELVQRWGEIGVEVEEARQILEQLRPSLEGVSEAEEKSATASAKAAAGTGRFSEEARRLQKSLDQLLPGLGKHFDTLVSGAAKVYVVVAALHAISAAAYEVGKSTGLLGEEGLENLKNFEGAFSKLLRLDVVGFARDAGQAIGGTVAAIGEGAKAAEEALGPAAKANEKAREELRASLAALREMKGERQAAAEEADAQAEALVRLARSERESGEVTNETRAAIEKLVREYEARGQKAPEALEKERAALGILTEAEEEAADAARKRGEEAEKASERARAALEREVEGIEGSASALAERTQLFLAAVAAAEEDGTVTVAAQERIQAKLRELLEDFRRFGVEPPEEIQSVIDKYGQLEAAGAAVADQQREIEEAAKAAAEALKAQVDAARAAQGDAEKSVAETQARISELERKGQDGALTLAEDQELFDLRAKLFDQQQALNQATEEAEVASLDLEQAQAGLGDQAAKNEQIFADLEMGLISQADAIRLLTAEDKKRTESLQDVYDAAVEAGAGAEQAQADFDAAFEGAADSAEEAAAAVAAAGEEGASGVREMGDAAEGAGAKLEQLGEKGRAAGEAGSAGLRNMREDVEWLNNEGLPTLTALLSEMQAVAASIELGGPADASEPIEG